MPKGMPISGPHGKYGRGKRGYRSVGRGTVTRRKLVRIKHLGRTVFRKIRRPI